MVVHILLVINAPDETWTRMIFLSRDFKSLMSAVPSRVQVMAYLHFLLFCITVQNDYYVTVCHLITIIKIFTARKQCILTTANEVWVNKMHPVGFEPTTNALKGHCSTNWATDAGERDIALCTGDWPPLQDLHLTALSLIYCTTFIIVLMTDWYIGARQPCWHPLHNVNHIS